MMYQTSQDKHYDKLNFTVFENNERKRVTKITVCRPMSVQSTLLYYCQRLLCFGVDGNVCLFYLLMFRRFGYITTCQCLILPF